MLRGLFDPKNVTSTAERLSPREVSDFHFRSFLALIYERFSVRAAGLPRIHRSSSREVCYMVENSVNCKAFHSEEWSQTGVGA